VDDFISCPICGERNDAAAMTCCSCGAAMTSGDILGNNGSGIETGAFRALGIVSIIGGLLWIFLLVNSLLSMSRSGIEVHSNSVANLNLIIPILFFTGGIFALTKPKQPKYVIAGGLLSGTLFVAYVWSLPLQFIITRYVSSEGYNSNSAVTALYLWPSLLLVGLVILISLFGGRFTERYRGVFIVIIAAVGAALGVIMYYYLIPLGRMLSTQGILFGYSVFGGRWYFFSIPLIAINLAVSLFLLEKHTVTYIKLSAAQLIFNALLSCVLFAVSSLGVVVAISEFLRAVISIRIVFHNKNNPVK